MTARRIWRLAGRDLAALALAIPAALVCTTLRTATTQLVGLG